MQRNNPFIIIGASVAGSFFVIELVLFYEFNFWTIDVKLKDFDTIMGVGVGVNLALGVLKGIRDTICSHFKLRFSGVKSDVVDMSKSLLLKGILTEDQAKEYEYTTDNLSLSIENNKAHEVVQTFVVFLAIFTTILYLSGLTVTAFNPAKMIPGWTGIFIVLMVLIPVGLYVLSISILAAYPEHKLRRALKALKGFVAVIGNGNGGPKIKPTPPTA